MRFRTLEIRWHDSKPISSCDFQHVPFKKARPATDKGYVEQSYRLATAAEDNHVRIWMVHPNITPACLVECASTSRAKIPAPRPPRVEYLATLSRHSAAVNVVRFSPNGELIASAGDDGMIIIWAPSSTPQASTYGSDLSPEDLQYEKEHWKPRTTFRCTTMQVYDLAWSPTGEYIIAGSTDNCARVYTTIDGKCVHEIAEHTHFVQGVAWDPLNEYIATQSSDRSMHIYAISTKHGAFEAHAVGKNTRLLHHHTRTPRSQSQSRPILMRRESTASDAESSVSEQKEEIYNSSSIVYNHAPAPLTPSTSVASTPSTSMFPPPPIDKPTSRRSSFSGSNAPSSPSYYGRFGRSPSPMPALPAIRSVPPVAAAARTSVKLYGDESFSNFFRRLTFSPDGGLLLTPAGHFEDPAIIIPGSSRSSSSKGDETPSRGRKRLSINTNSDLADPNSASSVFIYSRANFAKPPIGQLPGHKKASVAVRFSPVLYELRQGVVGGGCASGAEPPSEIKRAVIEKGRDGSMDVDVAGPTIPSVQDPPSSALKPQSTPPIVAPQPLPANARSMPSPSASSVELLRSPTPFTSKPATPVPNNHNLDHHTVNSGSATGSVFALPYRMLFAIVTMDTVAIYDTQQAGPICMLTKLHYDEFTDLSWSPDGQCLMLASRDGYCTIVVFDEIITAYHMQQHTLQLQSIAHHHSVPLTYSTPAHTPSTSSVTLPTAVGTQSAKKRVDPPATSAAGVPDSMPETVPAREADRNANDPAAGPRDESKPPKKKRRLALTKVGDLES